jgi:hypothetical protein
MIVEVLLMQLRIKRVKNKNNFFEKVGSRENLKVCCGAGGKENSLLRVFN